MLAQRDAMSYSSRVLWGGCEEILKIKKNVIQEFNIWFQSWFVLQIWFSEIYVIYVTSNILLVLMKRNFSMSR